MSTIQLEISDTLAQKFVPYHTPIQRSNPRSVEYLPERIHHYQISDFGLRIAEYKTKFGPI